MKRNIIITAMAVIATFVAGTVNVNAQEQATAQQLVEKLSKTLDKMKESQPLMNEVAQHTYIYDVEQLNLEFSGEKYAFKKAIRRNPTSGIAVGINAGCVQMAENFSPTIGGHATMAWKRFEGTVGMGLAISKYNAESNKSGKQFLCPIANGDWGIIISRFGSKNYDNQGYFSIGYSFMYVFDKNSNLSGETTYETPTEITTVSDVFSVEGNSMCHCGYVKYRRALKFLGVSAVSVKGFGGIYNRYYQEGSRRKAIIGASIAFELSGAKKRVDHNVYELQHDLEQLSVYQRANNK